MPQQRKPNDLSRSLIALDMDTTLIAVVELSLSNWLVAGIVPGIERQPLKRLKTDENALLALLNRWRDEAERSGHKISRIAVAFEAGRDGFWLARWLKARGIEAHVIHASSVAVSREHRRAKTDRLGSRPGAQLAAHRLCQPVPRCRSRRRPHLAGRARHGHPLGGRDRQARPSVTRLSRRRRLSPHGSADRLAPGAVHRKCPFDFGRPGHRSPELARRL